MIDESLEKINRITIQNHNLTVDLVSINESLDQLHLRAYDLVLFMTDSDYKKKVMKELELKKEWKRNI